MDFLTLIGACGAALILVAFVANEFGKLTARSLAYDLLNLAGAGFLLWYGVALAAWPFVVLNAIWALVAFRDVAGSLAGKRKNR